MKSQIAILKLVYPPISNQEAEWLKDDKDVQKEISNSNLYMICHRSETYFKLPDAKSLQLKPNSMIPFSIESSGIIDSGEIDVGRMIVEQNIDLGKYDIKMEIGEKLYRFWKISTENSECRDVIYWFTTEKIIYDRWRGHPVIKGFDNYREFTKYNLLYVGISKKQDSLKRLVIRPHDQRIRILSNENPINEGSRITDEIILLFFSVNPLRINIYDSDSDFEGILQDKIDKNPIISDAEKAYVNILNTKYNKVKFKEYPKGRDGLYDSELSNYSYIIGEDILLPIKNIVRLS